MARGTGLASLASSRYCRRVPAAVTGPCLATTLPLPALRCAPGCARRRRRRELRRQLRKRRLHDAVDAPPPLAPTHLPPVLPSPGHRHWRATSGLRGPLREEAGAVSPVRPFATGAGSQAEAGGALHSRGRERPVRSSSSGLPGTAAWPAGASGASTGALSAPRRPSSSLACALSFFQNLGGAIPPSWPPRPSDGTGHAEIVKLIWRSQAAAMWLPQGGVGAAGQQGMAPGTAQGARKARCGGGAATVGEQLMRAPRDAALQCTAPRRFPCCAAPRALLYPRAHRIRNSAALHTLLCCDITFQVRRYHLLSTA